MSNADDLFSSEDVENEEDSSLSAPHLLDNVVVTDSDWTAETVLSQVSKGNILLNPRFQRRDAWDDKRKSRFIESLIMGLPIPQLVLAEIKGHKGKFVVIDGKQRLLALSRFALDTSPTKLKLKGLDIRADLNGLTWDDIKSSPARHSDAAAFENAQIRTTAVKGWTDEKALYLIFHRLNSGSVALSPQELRHVLHPGSFIDFAFEFSGSSPVFIALLGNDGQPDFRMRDVELLIRFIGFQLFLDQYEGDLKQFLDKTVNLLNNSWNQSERDVRNRAAECEKAIELTTSIFGEREAFSKWSKSGAERRFNRAVFDVMTYFFSSEKARNKIQDDQLGDAIKNAFIELCLNSQPFIRSIETTTKSKSAVITRLWLWGRTLEPILGIQLDELKAIEAGANAHGLE
ncbi:DUF262 domain-containing protein [Herbaspirillum huttiense]|uniref:DUF262 domain-containing protein n=2 Tax=Herbaspirillum huttiense TaxID=863372 RepID=A0AAJ2HFA0_9BURK|nr:DUF262 domain-containing protein [Herbaspirillum huttiense]MDR9839382.1 DUF262 domain-containing protein [Herbaspirillum huttiense]